MNSTDGRLSTDTHSIQSITQAAAQRLGTGELEVPPDHDFLADVQADQRLIALMSSVSWVVCSAGFGATAASSWLSATWAVSLSGVIAKSCEPPSPCWQVTQLEGKKPDVLPQLGDVETPQIVVQYRGLYTVEP